MDKKDIYFEVLDFVHNGLFMADNSDVFECNNFNEVGNIAISIILNKFDDITYEELKQIICIRLKYDKSKYQKTSYDDLCLLLCEEIIQFKMIPSEELAVVTDFYKGTQKRYYRLVDKLSTEISAIDDLIKKDKENAQNNGSLIQKQEKICSRNANNKSLLKDLKRIEDDYISICDEIQENYVRQEMLKYAMTQIEDYFSKTTLNKPQDIVKRNLQTMALELATEEGDVRVFKNDFVEYDRFLVAWDNAIQSIYKPFFMIKMRKYYDDISDFFNENYYSIYLDKTEELIKLCKEKEKSIKDSDAWISIMERDDIQYLKAFTAHVDDFKVLDYLKGKIDSLYCIQGRKEIMLLLIEYFENKNYLVFVNLAAIQIEGLFYDLFLDANTQNRLNGKFDMFESDNLKNKFGKNVSIGDLEEATLYFNFYFNNIIRNKIAHGKLNYNLKELEITAFELLLDFQYVIHLISLKSDTNAAIEYIQHEVKWLEFSFKKEKKNEDIYAKLLNSLNANVIKSNKGSVSYVDPQQELYWIFNPYYAEAYTFAHIIDKRDTLINYLTSPAFWQYVKQYLITYDKEDVFQDIKIKRDFISRVKAIKMYVAKNKKETLPILVDVEKELHKLNLIE